MRIRIVALLAFVLPLAAFGQMDDNTLMVTSTSTVSFQPDQVVLSIYADFEQTASLDDVLSAVQSVGITSANLSSASSTSVRNLQATEWYFLLPVPFSKLSEKLADLEALQKSIGRNRSRFLGYSLSGTQVSPELQASSKCSYGPLFQDAISQARTLAAAAGVMLGPVVAISDSTDAPSLSTGFASFLVPIVDPVVSILP